MSVRTTDKRRLRSGTLGRSGAQAKNNVCTVSRPRAEAEVVLPHRFGRRRQLHLLLRLRSLVAKQVCLAKLTKDQLRHHLRCEGHLRHRRHRRSLVLSDLLARGLSLRRVGRSHHR